MTGLAGHLGAAQPEANESLGGTDTRPADVARPELQDGNLWPGPEQTLLLRAATADGDRAITAFRDWCEQVDFDRQVSWSTMRLLPAVYANMLRLGVTTPLMGRLKGLYRRAWVANNTLFARVAPAIRALSDSGLPLLLLKGIPLSHAYNASHAVRPMMDADVCVHYSDATRAVEMLRALGWVPTCELTDDRLQFFHALQFLHPDGGQIDLHWHVMVETPAAELDALFWEATEPLQFQGVTVKMLRSTEQLFHVMLHGVHWNEETPIRWIIDSAAIIRARADDIDWARVEALAVRLKVTYRIGIALAFLQREGFATVPAEVVARMQAHRPGLMERIEASVVLENYLQWERSAMRFQWTILADCARLVDPNSGPWRFLATYSKYLRFRHNVGSRRELIPIVARAVGRRLLRRLRTPAVASGA